MHDRVEALKEYGVLQCPGWCAHPEDEAHYEQHLGEWTTAVDDGEVAIQVRPRREWWTQGKESDCAGNVDVVLSGPYAAGYLDQAQPGAVASAILTEDDVQRLIDALENAKAMAESPDDWEWAYPGAEDDAEDEDDEEGEGDDD